MTTQSQIIRVRGQPVHHCRRNIASEHTLYGLKSLGFGQIVHDDGHALRLASAISERSQIYIEVHPAPMG